jgi:hypothetical protein
MPVYREAQYASRSFDSVGKIPDFLDSSPIGTDGIDFLDCLEAQGAMSAIGT